MAQFLLAKGMGSNTGANPIKYFHSQVHNLLSI